ncbi:MAG: caspase family protein [Deltaproteobacteria bacterium]|nr:caspase family protein [Deltaproteobacteria bacterium]
MPIDAGHAEKSLPSLRRPFAGLGLLLLLLGASLPFIFGGCATVRPQVVSLCENQRCDTMSETSSKEDLLVRLFNYLKKNTHTELTVVEGDPPEKSEPGKAFEQAKDSFSFYAQGGPMPGVATVKALTFSDVLYVDRENLEIKFKVSPSVNWNATPMFFVNTEGVLSIKSAREISYTSTYFGTWMVVGTSAWKHDWFIDYVDFDRGVLGGPYSIAGGGPLTVGGGKGYLYLKFREAPSAGPLAATSPVAPAKALGPPVLTMAAAVSESSGNAVFDGGEEVALRVEVENRGEGGAQEVEVLLSGSPSLIGYFGDKRVLGDLAAGQKKTAEFKAVLPVQIKAEAAEIRVAVREAKGFAPAEDKVLKIATRPGQVRETVEVISELPQLAFKVSLRDQNRNSVLEGGEEVVVTVAVENKGEGAARDVRVLLSGTPALVGVLGEQKTLGAVGPGERKIAEFKGKLPAQVPSQTASLRITLQEGQTGAPMDSRVLRVALRAPEAQEVVEVISEVNVDDIPAKVKGHVAPDNYALVVGIGEYREKVIPAVKYASRDAEVVARHLENIGGIPKANIKLLTDSKATKSDIEAQIQEWLPRRVTKDSTVFVYYAGHGAPGNSGQEAYIVPYEGNPDYPSQLYPLEKMYRALSGLSAKNVVVLLDSCFSGAKGRSVTGEGTRPLTISIENPVLAGGKVTVLAAADGAQVSSDYDKVQHGLFTYYLLRGLRGEADGSGKGVVELGELYRFVRAHVAALASLEMNRDQTPILLPAGPAEDQRLKIPLTRTK